MPYYQGDYYQGDPGFLSVLKRIGGAVAGFIPGGGAITALARRAPVGIMPRAISRMGQAGQAVAGLARRRPGVAGAVIGTAAGAGMAGIAAEVMGRGGRPGRMPGMRRRRRMHVTNMKALRRAIRRAHGFAKIARRVLHFTSPRAPRGRPLFKHKRKAKL